MRKMTIEQEIQAAKQFYWRHQGIFIGEPAIVEKIEKYGAAISRTNLEMEELGVSAACSRCAQKKPGSCCFRGVEEWYDAAPLVINLLMGVELPADREVQDGCLFLGSKGCKLMGRHSFCVNYLCPELMASLTEAQRGTLAAISGNELLLAWELEKSVRDRLRVCAETGIRAALPQMSHALPDR